MKWVKPRELELENFGPFVGKHRIILPESGMVLVKGRVIDTGDGSGSGKSYLLNALAYLFGACPFPATELQSWYTEEPLKVRGVFDTDEGTVTAERGQGLILKGGRASKGLRGKAAEAELDRIFGMDADLRTLVTYRQQGQGGMFLELPDAKKKEFLGRVLGLDRFEKVAAEASENAKVKREQVSRAETLVEAAKASLKATQAVLGPVDTGVSAKSLDIKIDDHEQVAKQLETEIQNILSKINDLRTFSASKIEAATSEIRAKIYIVNSRVTNQELLEARTSLEKVRGRIQKVNEHDAEGRTTHEQRRSELRIAISKLEIQVRDRQRMEVKLRELNQEKEALIQQTCPTCYQSWKNKSAIDKLASVSQELDSVVKYLSNKSPEEELVQISKQLSELGLYVSHPIGVQLKEILIKAEELVIKLESEVEVIQARELKKLSIEEDEVKSKINKQTKILLDNYSSVVADLEAKRLQEITTAAHLRKCANEARIWEATRAERLKAVKLAEQACLESNEEVTKVQAELKTELDIIALVGREGFLGLIFEDVLAEIAAAANDILGRVANVRHVTFDFESEKESVSGGVIRRITPVVYVRGKRVAFRSGASGGMQSAIHQAVDLGVGEVVAKRRGAYPGWLILDESFDGLGPVSKESCLEVLSAHAGDRLVLVVDHDSRFQGLFGQTIEIEQTVDGRSRINI